MDGWHEKKIIYNNNGVGFIVIFFFRWIVRTSSISSVGVGRAVSIKLDANVAHRDTLPSLIEHRCNNKKVEEKNDYLDKKKRNRKNSRDPHRLRRPEADQVVGKPEAVFQQQPRKLCVVFLLILSDAIIESLTVLFFFPPLAPCSATCL